MIVDISKGGKKGTIDLNEKTMEFEVDFPVKATATSIRKYFGRKRSYKIPESDRIDDYRVEKKVPTESPMHFDLALCELYNNLGVFVIWRGEDK